MNEHFDVLIVGAGLSGIGAAHHLQAAFPARTYAILEARDAIGGTWDLFRYPGVRSDSDMHTLGYRFRPWTEARAIADGPSIAVTLVPALAETAGHVTMLQRSPSYILTMPTEDAIASRLRALLGPRRGYAVTRWKNVAIMTLIYQLSRRRPEMIRGWIRKLAVRQLPAGYEVDTHFKPAYNPWDQRLCLVPDGDLFKAISAGRASVVTGRIAALSGGSSPRHQHSVSAGVASRHGLRAWPASARGVSRARARSFGIICRRLTIAGRESLRGPGGTRGRLDSA
jgi:cation diffusion facilitator CzcD-associated flavoprotein CzcO